MKLYKRISRFKFLRHVPKRVHSTLRWGMSLEPGDIINDCSLFNTRIREIDIITSYTKRGWFIYDVDYTTEPFGGSCSLRHCGVQPARSPEEIVSTFEDFYENWDTTSGFKFKTEEDPIYMRLQRGLPICDDQGMKHPELIQETIRKYNL